MLHGKVPLHIGNSPKGPAPVPLGLTGSLEGCGRVPGVEEAAPQGIQAAQRARRDLLEALSLFVLLV
jgi:hypothetical protein